MSDQWLDPFVIVDENDKAVGPVEVILLTSFLVLFTGVMSGGQHAHSRSVQLPLKRAPKSRILLLDLHYVEWGQKKR